MFKEEIIAMNTIIQTVKKWNSIVRIKMRMPFMHTNYKF